MNEEEKKAIELLEDIKNNSWTTKYIMSSDSKNAELLLNLIEKLQKENEELKDFKKQVTYIENTNFIKYKNYIPVQIIKDFIKKYQKLSDEFYEKFLETNRTDKDLHDVGLACDAKVQVLQELLESEE